MNPRRIILGLIVLTVAVFCLLSAAKLTATPKYDSIQVGMTGEEAAAIFGNHFGWPIFVSGPGPWRSEQQFDCDEGRVLVAVEMRADSEMSTSVTGKSITRRGPLERLAWLVGWRRKATQPL